MRRDDGAADGEAKTQTLLAEGYKRLEYPLELSRWDPRTSIGHDELDEPVFGSGR